MKTLLYLHGYKTCFNPHASKVKTLSGHWNVGGKTWDWDKSPHELKKDLLRTFDYLQPHFIVGSSLGGYWAALLGNEMGVPFVCINPAIQPAEVVDGVFEPFPTSGKGLILLDDGDQTISAHRTWDTLSPFHSIQMFGGGDHRFQHMEISIPIIKLFLGRG